MLTYKFVMYYMNVLRVPCFIELYPEGALCGERIDLFNVESREDVRINF